MRSVSRTTVAAAAMLGVLLAGACAQPGSGSAAGTGGGTDDGAGRTATGGSGPDDAVSDENDGQPSTSTAPAPAAPIPAELTISVDDGSGNTSTYSLTCVPAGGDHPDPDAACAGLATAGIDAFGPLDPGVACTEIYGGPQTATVTGQVDGTRVNSSFGRTNGCQIARWDALSTVFASPGGAN